MEHRQQPFAGNSRLDDLNSYHLVDREGGPDFQFLAKLSAQIAGVPMALISLVTANKQWNLARFGLDIQEIPIEHSICSKAVEANKGPLIIDDLPKLTEFANNPLVTKEPALYFYAGFPLVNRTGNALGTLCVMDSRSQVLTKEQQENLENISKQVVQLLELHKSELEWESNNQALKNNLDLLEVTMQANNIGTWELDISTGKTIWSDTVYHIHEVPLDFDHNKANGIEFYHPDFRNTIIDALTNCIQNNEDFDVTCILITAKGNQKWVRSTGKKLGDKLIGSFQDITIIKQNELKFKGIFNSTFSFIGLLDTSGILLEANDTAIQMAGLQPSDVIGKPFWDCYWWQIHPKAQEDLKSNFIKALAGDQVVYEVAVWIANKTPITILFSLKPVFNDAGKVAFVIPEGRPIQDLVDERIRLKSVLEGTNVGTWEWNVQTGETVFNDRWAEIVGYTLQELEPIDINTWIRLSHPDDLEESGKRLERCFSKQSEFYEMEVRMKHKEGHWVWVYDRGKVFEWTEDGKPLKMFGTHQEITSRKLKEEETAYHSNLLNALFENSPIGIALNDFGTGKFIDVNSKLVEPTGYSKEEFLELSYWDITPKEYEAQEAEMLNQMNASGTYGPYEKEYIRKDGTRYPVLLRGIVVEDLNKQKLIWSYIQDISREKEAEQKMQEALVRLQGIVDASTQVSIIATDALGTIEIFNSGAELMLGHATHEMVGHMRLDQLIDEAELDAARNLLLKEYGQLFSKHDTLVYNLRQGQAETKEYSFVSKDGNKIPVLLSLTTIMKGNEVTGYLSVATNIAELKSVESEIKSLLDITQRQNNRLRNFAYIVSHNLRSHSSGMEGILSMLHEEIPELSTNEYYELLQKASSGLKQTVEDLSEVVRVNLTELAPTQVNLAEVTDKNIASLAALIKGAGLQVINKIPKNAVVSGVPAYLDSIVLNLLTNAIKYRSEFRQSTLEINAIEEENHWIISFKDNGLGIDLNRHGDRLFGMYKTFHWHPDSRGVGLFITKNQIESMGGKIEVDSEVNVGTTFTITLPK